MRSKVTIDDIARRCGISQTTVSLVLRDKPGIGAETRQRVLATAKELGYRRRSSAPLTPGHTPLNIGLVVRSRDQSDSGRLAGLDSFYATVLAGIESTSRSQQMNLLYATLPVDEANRPLDVPAHLLTQGLDGLLLAGAFSAATVAEIASRSAAPIVLVDAPFGSYAHDAIVCDNRAGTYSAVGYLIERGHKQIAFIAPPAGADPNLDQRRGGYEKAIREYGLEPFKAQMNAYDATAATVELLQRHPTVTALVACNDFCAIETLRAAQAMGRSVPDSLSIVGFDDIELAGLVVPALTTMAVDKVTMGSLAVQTLSFRLTRPDAARILTVLQPELVERASVISAPPARAS